MSVDIEKARAYYREGEGILAVKELRSDGATLKEALALREEILTEDDRAVFAARQAAKPPNPWVQSAPNIWEPHSQVVERAKKKDQT